MADGMVIFLNGTSSAGKTSIARALQERADVPWLHLAVDQFLVAVPARFWEGAEVGAINAHRAAIISGFHRCIAALAQAGNNVVVDHVLQEEAWWGECAALLAPLGAALVEVACPLGELERREAARGDRPVGLARIQHGRVYGRGAYDIRVDTSRERAEACADRIAAYARSGERPSAFARVLREGAAR